MKRSAKLHDLIKLAELKKAMALDQLSNIQKRQRYIYEQLKCNDEKREELCSFVISHPTDTVRAQKYGEWLATVRHDLETNLAILRPEYEQSYAASNQAFGRTQSLKELYATVIEKEGIK
ncbi:hypothetical protein [Phaeovulum sp.]|uniref:hypothetical protein n=1 Tax=Phaeovulum sp. TaxID=2934796 RepID=UPI0039E63397